MNLIADRRLALCLPAFLIGCLVPGCSTSGWHELQPHYDSSRPPKAYSSLLLNSASALHHLWRTSDGSQLWSVGEHGTILHYTAQSGRWEPQTSGTDKELASITGTSDGSQLWAVGEEGTILHYTAQSGRWEPQASNTDSDLISIAGASDGSQLWAVGKWGTILHYTRQSGRWESQNSGTDLDDLASITGTSDGSQLWVAGDEGMILHYTAQSGRWESQNSGTKSDLYSITGTSDGSQLCAVGEFGTILHYTIQSGRWEPQTSGTRWDLYSVAGTSDGTRLWAVGDLGTMLYYTAQSGRWEPLTIGTDSDLAFITGTGDGSQLWAVGENGTILHYTAQSASWEPQTSVIGADLASIAGTSDGSQLWAVGKSGTILHYTSRSGGWEPQSSGTDEGLASVTSTGDGSQLWGVGNRGTILHYTSQSGRWQPQSSGTDRNLASVTGNSGGLWAVGEHGTILHYTAQSGGWEPQSSGTDKDLDSIAGTGDGSQLWAVGKGGTILHYTAQSGRWEPQTSGTDKELASVINTADGSQLWAVGNGGTILHYTAQSGRWEPLTSGTDSDLAFITGTGDGSELWAVSYGTILHYDAHSGRWDSQFSATGRHLAAITGTSDGSQLWAVGEYGTILGVRPVAAAYISQVRLLATPTGAQLQVRIVEPQTPVEGGIETTVAGARESSFEKGYPLKPVKVSPVPSNRPMDLRQVDFNPADLDIQPGAEAHFQIRLKQGDYTGIYDAVLPFDRYRFFRDHWIGTLTIACVLSWILFLTVLLIFRPLWILGIYRNLKIYELIEEIKIPGAGNLLKFVLRFTILPWFFTHPRTLRAWVKENHARAASAWSASLRSSEEIERPDMDLTAPYVALPIQIQDVSRRLLNEPTARDLESLFAGERNAVQIVGPGGGGKTTLAKHIGDLALAGGELGAFHQLRLPIWIDEDFSDLVAVLKHKINGWRASGQEVEGTFLNALLRNGLLLVIVDRISERLPSTQTYLAGVYGSTQCNALLMTTRRPIAMGVPEQRFLFTQRLDSSTLLSFMTSVIKYHFRDCKEVGAKAFSTIQSQLELGKKLADLIAVRASTGNGIREVPMLPLPVVLFVSEAVALVRGGRSLDELPVSLPDVYANYLRRTNPKTPGIENSMADEDMLRAAKVLANLALDNEYTPREFSGELGSKRLKTEAPDLPAMANPIRRLAANGILFSKEIGGTTFYRFILDPIAEFLGAEAHFDSCADDEVRLKELIADSEKASGFYNALLLVIQARNARW